MNKFLNQTDFSHYQEIILDGIGKAQSPPKWKIFSKGREIVQSVNGLSALSPITDKYCSTVFPD